MILERGTASSRPSVPWRTIAASIAMVCATLVVLLILREITRVIAWVLVAGFVAVVLAPAVDMAKKHLHLPRAPATGLVFLVVLGLFGGMIYAFVRPVIDQVDTFLDTLPAVVEDAQQGRGTIGELVDRYNLSTVIAENRDKIQTQLTNAGSPALDVLRGIFNTFFSAITIVVLAFLLVLRGPQLGDTTLALIAPRHRERARLMGANTARAISGYMFGNLLISIVAGTSTYLLLLVLGVPYAGVIALFVAFADLIPMVGATLGAIPTIGLAFLHSTSAGIIALIFYIAYQQFENHVLQVTVMSKTVDVNPLTVIISVLVGIELFGFLGALLAIPAAGTVQVILRDLIKELRHPESLKTL
ncbi:MAG: AI-2E family transporter [Acidimicrobiales bacterium]